MSVFMRTRFMYVHMAVFSGYRRFVLMIMMPVIVIMGVFMLNQIVCMLMIVLLKCRKIRAYGHHGKCRQKRD